MDFLVDQQPLCTVQAARFSTLLRMGRDDTIVFDTDAEPAVQRFPDCQKLLLGERISTTVWMDLIHKQHFSPVNISHARDDALIEKQRANGGSTLADTLPRPVGVGVPP